MRTNGAKILGALIAVSMAMPALAGDASADQRELPFYRGALSRGNVEVASVTGEGDAATSCRCGSLHSAGAASGEPEKRDTQPNALQSQLVDGGGTVHR